MLDHTLVGRSYSGFADYVREGNYHDAKEIMDLFRELLANGIRAVTEQGCNPDESDTIKEMRDYIFSMESMFDVKGWKY